MVVAEALSTGQTGDERAAFGQTLSTNSRRGDCLPRDQTAGDLLPVLCAHRDGCHEDRRVGGGVSENQEREKERSHDPNQSWLLKKENRSEGYDSRSSSLRKESVVFEIGKPGLGKCL